MAWNRENKGMTGVMEIYKDRTVRVMELKSQGRRIMGYVCINPVLEMLTALDIVPYRILGNMDEPLIKVDSILPHVVCPFLRSIMELGLKGDYDFLDGAVMGHNCDVGQNLAFIWRTFIEEKQPFQYFLDYPHGVHPSALKKTKAILAEFQKSLEKFAGSKIALESLRKSVDLHNIQRALVRELYDLRKPDPPLISGTEILKVMVAVMSLPVEEGNALLREVMDEVKEREITVKKGPRLLIWGSILDDTALAGVIEELGAHVVMDDTCVGSRPYWSDVEITQDPLDGLTRRYLMDLRCPRTYREKEYGELKKSYSEDLENRFGYLGDFAGQWNVQGVILQSLRYCDIHGYEVPSVKDYFDHLGLPSIYLEHDYSKSGLAPIRTRIQAFLEMIDL